MKFKVGDQVLVTMGKDKGKKGAITKVLPKTGSVVVEGMNLYTRNIKPQSGQAGQQVRKERPLAAAKIAIINDKGVADRVGYKEVKGEKVRIYKKTGKPVATPATVTPKK